MDFRDFDRDTPLLGGILVKTREQEQECRALIAESTPQAIFVIRELMTSEDERMRYAAAKLIIEHNLGMPHKTEEVTGKNGAPILVTHDISNAIKELTERRDRLKQMAVLDGTATVIGVEEAEVVEEAEAVPVPEDK